MEMKIMATIKSHTDLEQSKKLAEILPIESADMHYATWTILDGDFIVSPNQGDTIKSLQEDYGNQIIPCWSLAALLDILTEQDFVIKTIGNEFNIDIPIRHCEIWFPSLLDAAFEMVCWLFENKKI